MEADPRRQKTIVIGAGPVGALAAVYAAQRGDEVEVYELRSDLRYPGTTPLNFTKSINLALSERGINAMRESGRPNILNKVTSETIPMRGRMIHGVKLPGEIYEASQDYDVHGQAIFAVDRGGLNKAILDELESMPNVTIFFNYKLTGADFKSRKAWFEVSTGKPLLDSVSKRHKEIEVNFDFLIGADGAHSAARYHMMKYVRMDYHQDYIDTLWCEFSIPAKEKKDANDLEASFRISPNYLHIWPGKDFMFIAIPSFDGSFTCTLFAPHHHYDKLERDPSSVPLFFDTNFPGVTAHIDPESLIASFTKNPHLPLISIKCQPYHFEGSAVVVGDAAHAMVPFYGQGMNAGLEDVRVLFSFLDAHTPSSFRPDLALEEAAIIEQKANTATHRAQALTQYSDFRKADAHAINDLALGNYTEMRTSVVSPVYRLRKWMEEQMSVYFPTLGWKTKYSMVSFGNERYSEVVRQSERQGRLLVMGLASVLTGSTVMSGLLIWSQWRRHGAGLRGPFGR